MQSSLGIIPAAPDFPTRHYCGLTNKMCLPAWRTQIQCLRSRNVSWARPDFEIGRSTDAKSSWER